MVGDVAEFVVVRERDAAPRLLLVQDGLDQQRGGEDLVARRIEQIGARHVCSARRLALAAAQAVLDRAGDAAKIGLVEDQRFGADEGEARRVGVGQVGAGQQLAGVEASLGIHLGLVGAERLELGRLEELELGDADAVLTGDRAAERARQRHDARHRVGGARQHLVVVRVDRDVGMHVAVARVHVQRDEHAPTKHASVDLLRALEDAAGTRRRRTGGAARPAARSSTKGAARRTAADRSSGRDRRRSPASGRAPGARARAPCAGRSPSAPLSSTTNSREKYSSRASSSASLFWTENSMLMRSTPSV